ncbi:16S rRNA (guanine(527)-N(7))-methyltransferase RsmG [Dissulfurispira sp.]|uniref:16S rRNA (guanine(527)-N(7))-methyltransferase RsmG n=1 Tax=Dissulfurispira sp. TaxID=2817609 RepID=UPI002FD94B01
MEREELLRKGLKELGFTPSASILSQFDKYLYELKKWNRAYNLTALKSDEDIIIKHFLDSLLYLKVIPEGQWSICDIGSGAGFPGIPMAIVRPEFNIVLIEPSRKKSAFLRHIKRTLPLLNAEVMESRIEDVKGRLFDVAVTRALFSVMDLIKKAGHILRKNGFFVLNKGPKFEDEISHLPGDVKFEVISVTLPCTPLQRNLIKVKIL